MKRPRALSILRGLKVSPSLKQDTAGMTKKDHQRNLGQHPNGHVFSTKASPIGAGKSRSQPGGRAAECYIGCINSDYLNNHVLYLRRLT